MRMSDNPLKIEYFLSRPANGFLGAGAERGKPQLPPSVAVRARHPARSRAAPRPVAASVRSSGEDELAVYSRVASLSASSRCVFTLAVQRTVYMYYVFFSRRPESYEPPHHRRHTSHRDAQTGDRRYGRDIHDPDAPHPTGTANTARPAIKSRSRLNAHMGRCLGRWTMDRDVDRRDRDMERHSTGRPVEHAPDSHE